MKNLKKSLLCSAALVLLSVGSLTGMNKNKQFDDDKHVSSSAHNLCVKPAEEDEGTPVQDQGKKTLLSPGSGGKISTLSSWNNIEYPHSETHDKIKENGDIFSSDEEEDGAKNKKNIDVKESEESSEKLGPIEEVFEEFLGVLKPFQNRPASGKEKKWVCDLDGKNIIRDKSPSCPKFNSF